MKNILIIGAKDYGVAILSLYQNTHSMNIFAISDNNPSAKGIKLAKQHHIPTYEDWKDGLSSHIDIIIDTIGIKDIKGIIEKQGYHNITIMPKHITDIIVSLKDINEPLVEQLTNHTHYQTLIMDHIQDGMIVIDEKEGVRFVNEAAENIVECKRENFINKRIQEVISHTELPRVLKTRKKEVNQKLTLDNGKRIITTRMPIIDHHNHLIGAISVFKDMTEIMHLANENTDLKEVQKMLEAIIQSSDEAISVVDEHGVGTIINTAYKRITGMEEQDIIGKPATTDITEGESVHMEVLRTRRPLRGIPMKVGLWQKEVIVNVSPIIVDGKLKGSVGIIRDISEIQKLTHELFRAKQIIRHLEVNYTFSDILGKSNEIKLAVEQGKLAAKTNMSVLVRGELGTGKTLFAHAIHNESERKYNQFVHVNCAGANDLTLKKKLFGYIREDMDNSAHVKGEFEKANKGTLFLDEVGELSLDLQEQILYVLQHQAIRPYGLNKSIPIDVRVITASKRNLETSITLNKFREDLYYNLNRFPIFLPSLNERREDIPKLVSDLINALNHEYSRNVAQMDGNVIDILKEHKWKSNIRELENIIRIAYMKMDIDENVIHKKHLPNDLLPFTDNIDKSINLYNKGSDLQTAVDYFEMTFIDKIYRKNDYNKSKTARELKISVRSLYYKIEKYGLEN